MEQKSYIKPTMTVIRLQPATGVLTSASQDPRSTMNVQYDEEDI